jgi:hypothetical protein
VSLQKRRDRPTDGLTGTSKRYLIKLFILRKEVTVLPLLAGLLKKKFDGRSILISIMIKNYRGNNSSAPEFCQIAKEILSGREFLPSTGGDSWEIS